MKSNHYLPVGFKLGGHYEIIKLLGEDDFEILYLVKDLHMGDKPFVLKEFFLPSYSSRNDDNTLHVMAKSKQIFEQTKKDMIQEIELLKSTQKEQSPQFYGYFEENHTLYTIMEFMNEGDPASYLELNTQEVPEEETRIKEKVKSSIFLKILIVCVLVFFGLAFYTYKMIEEDKAEIKARAEKKSLRVITESTRMAHPSLESYGEEKNESKEEVLQELPIEEKNTLAQTAEYIEPSEIVEEINENILKGVPSEEIVYIEEEVVFEEPTLLGPRVIEIPVSNRKTPNISLGTRIN